jgi:hypothetical protein
MAKYLSMNNKRQSSLSGVDLSVLGFFLVASLIFLLLPVMRYPFEGFWRAASLARVSLDEKFGEAYSMNTCLVIATPPKRRYDTVLLECNPAMTFSKDQFVWYNEGGVRYMVGRVDSVQSGRVTVRLFSTYDATRNFDVLLDGHLEKFTALPLGGGMFKVEVPSEVVVREGTEVKHVPSYQPLGVVSGISLEPGSLVQRVYIRLPFSFERLTHLQVD